MENKEFYAIVDSINETSNSSYTLGVMTEEGERFTLSISDEETLNLKTIYFFDVSPYEFKETVRYSINRYENIDTIKLDFSSRQELMSKFYDYAPVPISELKEIIEGYLIKIENPIIKEIVMYLYEARKDEFYLYPAATKLHHAYISGLSYHTSTMLQLIDGFKEVYPILNQDLLIAGVLLHDICKVRELSSYIGPEYTKEGKLLGHITMGVKAIELTALKLGHNGKEETLLLQHMILSHHYYGNYGSPKKPNIPEALILHFIDNIDSKMAALIDVFEDLKPGEFSAPITVLDREKYYKSKL